MRRKRSSLCLVLISALALGFSAPTKADGDLWGIVKTVTGINLIMGVADLAMEERSLKQATADKELQLRLNERFISGSSGFGGWANVNATVYNNVVLLTGRLESEDVRKKLVKDMTESGLVTQFIDRMTIEEENDPGMGDATETAFKVEAALRGQPGVSSSNLSWPISGGKVYLFGWTKDEREEKLARVAVGTVESVTGVESLIARPGKTLPITTVKKK